MDVCGYTCKSNWLSGSGHILYVWWVVQDIIHSGPLTFNSTYMSTLHLNKCIYSEHICCVVGFAVAYICTVVPTLIVKHGKKRQRVRVFSNVHARDSERTGEFKKTQEWGTSERKQESETECLSGRRVSRLRLKQGLKCMMTVKVKL